MRLMNILFGLILIFIGVNNFFPLIDFEYITWIYSVAILLVGFIMFSKNKLLGFFIMTTGLVYGASIFIEIISDYLIHINTLIIIFGILLLITASKKKVPVQSGISKKTNQTQKTRPVYQIQNQISQKRIQNKPKKVKTKIFKICYDPQKKNYYIKGGMAGRFTNFTGTSKEGLMEFVKSTYPNFNVIFK